MCTFASLQFEKSPAARVINGLLNKTSACFPSSIIKITVRKTPPCNCCTDPLSLCLILKSRLAAAFFLTHLEFPAKMHSCHADVALAHYIFVKCQAAKKKQSLPSFKGCFLFLKSCGSSYASIHLSHFLFNPTNINRSQIAHKGYNCL